MLELHTGRTPLAQTPSLLLGLPLAPLPKHHTGSQAGDPVVLAQDVLVSAGLGGQGWPRSIGLGRKKNQLLSMAGEENGVQGALFETKAPAALRTAPLFLKTHLGRAMSKRHAHLKQLTEFKSNLPGGKGSPNLSCAPREQEHHAGQGRAGAAGLCWALPGSLHILRQRQQQGVSDTRLPQLPGAVIYRAHKLQRRVHRNLLPPARAQSSSSGGAKPADGREAGRWLWHGEELLPCHRGVSRGISALCAA